MARYRTKTVEVDAVQWTGENREEVEALDPDHVVYYGYTNSFLIDAGESGEVCEQVPVGWYVVRLEDGELRRLRDSDFSAAYEPADAETASAATPGA